MFHYQFSTFILSTFMALFAFPSISQTVGNTLTCDAQKPQNHDTTHQMEAVLSVNKMNELIPIEVCVCACVFRIVQRCLLQPRLDVLSKLHPCSFSISCTTYEIESHLRHNLGSVGFRWMRLSNSTLSRTEEVKIKCQHQAPIIITLGLSDSKPLTMASE